MEGLLDLQTLSPNYTLLTSFTHSGEMELTLHQNTKLEEILGENKFDSAVY